jgi:hypothetical protein
MIYNSRTRTKDIYFSFKGEEFYTFERRIRG